MTSHLKQVPYPAAVQAHYQKQLLALTRKMWSDVNADLMQYYRDYNFNPSPLAVNELVTKVNNSVDKWQKVFDEAAALMAVVFVGQISKIAANNVENNIKHFYGNEKTTNVVLEPVIRLSPKMVKQLPIAIQQSLIKSNVALIKDIPQKMRTQIESQVLRCVQEGRSATYLEQQLLKIGGMTKRRAAFIASDQMCKATENISRALYLEKGFTKGEWVYTWRSKEPRQSHIHADGKLYSLNKGCKIDGKYIYPGQLPGCKCSFRPL